eukprot:scaffold99137_cov24-Phaeocystis_antarctica.AAC.1
MLVTLKLTLTPTPSPNPKPDQVGGAAVHMLVMPSETHPTLDAERGALTEPNPNPNPNPNPTF